MKRIVMAATTLLGASSLLLMQCRTLSGSRVLDGDNVPPEQQCMPPLDWYDANPLQRLTTAELEKHIRDRVEATQWECDINSSLAAASFGLPIPDGEDAKAYLESKGGFFGGMANIQTPSGPTQIPIYDNKMRYLWSEDGTKGQFLPPEKWYNHIIPLRDGINQPEMRKYLKSGDIIVYFYNGDRNGTLDSYNQFRSGHSATILENRSDDGQDYLMILDTPGAYARPITGADQSVFHVYRMMPRDDQGNAYPAAKADGYRAQVAKWGTLALDRFPFEGNYDRLTFKSADQIDYYAKRYMATQFAAFDSAGLEIIPMYCAWYSFMNLTLGYMRPMNQDGLANLSFDPPGSPVQPLYSRLTADPQEPNGYLFPRVQDAATLGDSTFKQNYEAPADLKRHDQMLIHPVTAPELVMNFLDRTIGPDAWVPEAQWQQHAGMKIAVLQGGMQGFLQKFATAPDPNRDFPELGNAPQGDYDAYNDQLQRMFDAVLQLYQGSLALTGTQLADAREQIRSKTYELVETERKKPRIPKKWIPPYMYTREAEAYESLYRPPVNNVPYSPRVVYVGTVVPGKFLKNWGATEDAIVTPIREVDATNEDWEAQQKALTFLRSIGSEFHSNKSAIDALMLELYKQCRDKDQATCDGLNKAELSALMALRNHWRQDLTWMQPGDAPPDQVLLHNTYGLDDYLMLRTLISYWNNPTDFRAAIYEGAGSTIATAAVNLRIIMSLPPAELKPDNERVKPSALTQGHPRRSTPVQCKSDNATVIDETNQKCADIVRPGNDGGFFPF